MDNTIYWVWLSQALGDAAYTREIISYYSNAETIYKADENELRSSGLFGNGFFEIRTNAIEKLMNKSLDSAKKIVESCCSNSVSIVTYEDELYPEQLKRIADFPPVLYCVGDLSCLKDKLALAVVGTRKPSLYGIEAATKLSRQLAKQDTVIVSGGALGIDSIAHMSALEEKAKTVLVLGCGHFANYLKQNEALRRQVSENGAVISEYPPFTKAAPYLFPKRNRIISGISKGVVIIEAGEKSGTLNTAKHAKSQGRDIFAVPGDISSVAYSGSNTLIKQGARAVFSADDILSYYNYEIKAMSEIHKDANRSLFDGIDVFKYGEGEKTKRKSSSKQKTIEKEEENTKEIEIFQKFNAETVSDNAKLVYNHMSSESMSLDDLTRKCALPVRKVLIALTELEMAGAIKQQSGGNYCVCS